MSDKTYYTFATKEELLNVGVAETKITECVVTYDGNMLNQAEMDLEQAKSLIPEGTYCYSADGLCPFWERNKQFPEQANGYCHFLNHGDWQEKGLGLLWDQCKECGVKEYTDNYEG